MSLCYSFWIELLLCVGWSALFVFLLQQVSVQIRLWYKICLPDSFVAITSGISKIFHALVFCVTSFELIVSILSLSSISQESSSPSSPSALTIASLSHATLPAIVFFLLLDLSFLIISVFILCFS